MRTRTWPRRKGSARTESGAGTELGRQGLVQGRLERIQQLNRIVHAQLRGSRV